MDDENNWSGEELLSHALIHKKDENYLEYVYFLALACGKQHLPALEEYAKFCYIPDWTEIYGMCLQEAESNPNPAYFLGFLAYIYTSEGVKQDCNHAIDCHQRAMNVDDLYLQYSSKLIVSLGIELLKNNRLEDGSYWLSRVIDLNNIFKLGVMYKTGISVITQDNELAAKLFQVASNQGHCGATGNLAKMYMLGSGIACDPVKAAELFAKYAELAKLEND